MLPSLAQREGRAAGPVRNSWEGREGESLCDSDNPSKTPEIVIHPCFFFIPTIPKSVPVSFVPELVKFNYRGIKPRTEGSDSQGGSLRSAILQRESAVGIRVGKVRQSPCHTLPRPGSLLAIATGRGWKGRGGAKSTCSQETHLARGSVAEVNVRTQMHRAKSFQ